MRSTAALLRTPSILETFRDREFLSRLFHIAIPVMLQNFLYASLNLVGVVMIGQLGEDAIAAAGLGNQIFMLLFFLLFGASTGAAAFSAQLWGKQDVPSIRRVLGLSLAVGLIGSSLFFILAVFFPQAALSVYTEDPAVIALGAGYLRILGLSFFFTAVSYSYASVLRSTGDVRTPLYVTIFSLSLNTLLSYGLIFGRLGLPELGVKGAALGATIARTVDCLLLLAIVYWKRLPAAAMPREMFSFDQVFARTVLGRALPVAFNEVFWSLGITTYNIIYARISTEAIAAINISSPIENLAFVVFIGISDACAILVGHRIGAGEDSKAFSYAGRSLFLGMSGAVLMGLVIAGGADTILSLYKVPAVVSQYAHNILLVIAMTLWLRVSNMTLFVGIFRSGGDTRFGFLLDSLSIWLVGVPLAYAGAFLFDLPVYFVFLMVMGEEFFKWIIAMFRFFSKKWINNLAEAI